MKRKIEKDLMFIIESEIRTDLCILDKVERDVEVNGYLRKNLMDRLLEQRDIKAELVQPRVLKYKTSDNLLITLYQVDAFDTPNRIFAVKSESSCAKTSHQLKRLKGEVNDFSGECNLHTCFESKTNTNLIVIL